ncbi:GNAT family N-acetyltransferase [Massilia sp. MB5]|uniref:GNAT family N-acetyltransferase n=1 Tax=unclassified Massilia TaxID=2609279 RepID=UPI00067D5700|nr:MULTISPECIES: GNAT family N-acetyltransferase [unclassified Massilia]AKU24663.1 acetyltransferase [Massilia sp. NR 4-1]UMR29673.1 GNAT family N-acetyltransferase [Massilia sp. MB5]
MDQIQLQIRAFEAGDTGRLSEIWFEASRRAHAFLGEARLDGQRTLIEEVYLPNAETWVACLAGAPVGFIGLVDCFVGGMFVDPDRQGSGIGRALAAHALALKGQLELEAYAENRAACAFYRHLGFEEISRRPEDDDGLPFEVILMRLRNIDRSATQMADA